ncbi:MAG: hypothetical protein ACLVC2_15020, partial [Emergencia timonensis]
YIKKNGKQAFLKLVENALPYGDYKLESAKKGFDLSKDEDKIDYIKKATDIIRQLSPVEQEIYIKKTAKDLKIAEGAIRMELLGNDSTEKASFTPVREEKEEVLNSEITPIERTLLKVMLTDESYISRISDFPQILESDFAIKIFEILKEEYLKNQFIDLNKIMDGLTSEGAACLQEIVDDVIVGGNEEQVFNDCIRTWKDKNLAKEEQRLISLLSMADEEDNQERIRELTDQLMKVQKERKTNSRGI